MCLGKKEEEEEEEEDGCKCHAGRREEGRQLEGKKKESSCVDLSHDFSTFDLTSEKKRSRS